MEERIKIVPKRNEVIYGNIKANTKIVKLIQRVIKRLILFLNFMSISSVFFGGIKEIKIPEVARPNNVA
jgi:hypothetical protein